MVKVVVFDLDGTIYFGDRLADKAEDVLNRLHQQCVKTCFLTNNSRKGRYEIYEKLVGFGLNLNIEDVYTSSYLAGRYLKENGYTSAYVLGEKGLIKEIEYFGIDCKNPDPDCVVVGYDMTLNYDKITNSFRQILAKKTFVACNIDKSYPVESGLLPGCGAMVGAIYGCTGLMPDVIVGKPSVYPIKVICKDYGVEIQDIIVVGDNIESDIAMAKNAGCKSCLVSSENTGTDYVIINSLDQIIEIINGDV